MIRGIHHIAMHTANFDRMVRFYSEAFGFQPVGPEYRWENNPAVDKTTGTKGSAARSLMLQAGNCYLEMFEYFAPKGRDASPLRPQDHGYTHFCVDVTDIAAEQQRLQDVGMTFVNPEPVDHGDIKAVYGRDIDGNLIEILETTPGVAFTLARLKGFDFG
jgi:glyoxylase I family protein